MLSMLLVGCSKYTNDPPPQASLGNLPQMAKCSNDLNKILEKNISADLRCLNDQLITVSKRVVTIVPGHLSRKNLESIIDDLQFTNPTKTKKGLAILFAINYLLMGARDMQEISLVNLNKIFNFLISFNQKYVSLIKPALNAETLTYREYMSYRKNMVTVAKDLVNELGGIFVARNNVKINIIFDFLDNLTVDDSDGNQTIDTAQTFLFVKKVLLGGEKDTLTNLEFSRLMSIVPDLIRSAYDILQAPNIWFADDLSDEESHDRNEYRKYHIINEAIKTIKKTFYDFNGTDANLFSNQEALDVLNYFHKKMPDLIPESSGMEKQVNTFKELFLGGECGGYFKTHNIDKAFNLLSEMLNKMRVFYFMFSYVDASGEINFKKYLENPYPIKIYPKNPEKEDYILQKMRSLYLHSDDEKYRNDFINMISRYKFFNSETIELTELDPDGNQKIVKKSVPNFGFGIRRTKAGVATLGVLEHIVALIFDVYGANSKDLYQGFVESCNEQKVDCQSIGNKDLRIQENMCKADCTRNICRDAYLPEYDLSGGGTDNKSCKKRIKVCQSNCEMPEGFGGIVPKKELSLTYCKSVKKDKVGACSFAEKYKNHKDQFGFGKVLDVARLKVALDDFDIVLDSLHLLNPVSTKIQSNTALMTIDVFQYQSNGDGLMDVPEFTEYLSHGLTSSKFVEHLNNAFASLCEVDKEKGALTECVAQHFWDELFKYKSFMPEMYNYVELNIGKNSEAKVDYFYKLTKFALDPCSATNECERSYISKRDLVLIVGAIFNVENVMFRFDNQSGGVGDSILDYNELRFAFDNVLKDIVHDYVSEIPSKWHDMAFDGLLYLIKYGKLPEPLLREFMRFRILEKKKGITATRMSIVTLLEFIGDPDGIKNLPQ